MVDILLVLVFITVIANTINIQFEFITPYLTASNTRRAFKYRIFGLELINDNAPELLILPY